MTHSAQSAHLGSSLSTADLLAVLYRGSAARADRRTPNGRTRDRFILSKGHACAAYYAVLAECGFFPQDWLDTFYQNGSRLAGHATCGADSRASRSPRARSGTACPSRRAWRWRPSATASLTVSSAC